MEPQIRYARTSDGVRIAWGEVGGGPSLLHFQKVPLSHIHETFAVAAPYHDLARSSAGVEFEDRGEQEMKGVGEPHEVQIWLPKVGVEPTRALPPNGS